MDRVVSFSVQPTDRQAKENIKKLKSYCDKTGVSFSFLMLKAIAQLNKDLGLNDDTTKN